MEWIFLSPHFDDVALSCGGLIWEQVQAGERVSIWTICGGLPPRRPLSPFAQSLHQRWETGAEAVRLRQAEDRASCQILGASYRHFSIPDCIYRPRKRSIPHYYATEESLWGKLHANEEKNLVHRLTKMLDKEISPYAKIVCPLTLGNHVDHILTRKAAERLKRPLLYFEDYPYVLKSADELAQLKRNGWKPISFHISEAGICAWQEAIAAHTSQISTFWPSLSAMRAAIREYAHGQVTLWERG